MLRLTSLPAGLGALTGLQQLILQDCARSTALPDGLETLTGLQKLVLEGCSRLTALPAGLGALTGLQKLYLSGCSGTTPLQAGLGALTGLQELGLMKCPALHTPPSRVVRLGRDAMLAHLRDLVAGSATRHLVKLVLLGEQGAGKSSLADSLVNCFSATQPADDRTVGIDVRRWWLGAGQGIDSKEEELVVHIYDAGGHRVYRAAEIGCQVRSVGEAIRQAEAEFESDVVCRYQQSPKSRGDTAQESVDRRSVANGSQDEWSGDRAMQQEATECEADAKWRENQALRDTALEALDRGLTAWQETGVKLAVSESIDQVLGTLAKLASLHRRDAKARGAHVARM